MGLGPNTKLSQIPMNLRLVASLNVGQTLAIEIGESGQSYVGVLQRKESYAMMSVGDTRPESCLFVHDFNSPILGGRETSNFRSNLLA